MTGRSSQLLQLLEWSGFALSAWLFVAAFYCLSLHHLFPSQLLLLIRTLQLVSALFFFQIVVMRRLRMSVLTRPPRRSNVRIKLVCRCLNVICLAHIVSLMFVIPTVAETGSLEVAELMGEGLRNYLEDERWKKAWDIVQQELSCCGILGLDDWLKVSWVPLRFIRTNHPGPSIARLLKVEDGGLTGGSVPWSCCSRRVASPCFYGPLQEHGETLSRQTLFSHGCLHSLCDPTLHSVWYFTGILLLMAVIQICIGVVDEKYTWGGGRRRSFPWLYSSFRPSFKSTPRHLFKFLPRNKNQSKAGLEREGSTVRRRRIPGWTSLVRRYNKRLTAEEAQVEQVRTTGQVAAPSSSEQGQHLLIKG